MQRVRVWDLPTRICHWGLVLCISGAYLTGEYGWLDMQWHFWFGYGVLGLVLFRILWGFVGGEYARFNRFLRGPEAVLRYVENWRGASYLGHNPLGALSVIAMLGAILVQALTGLFSSDDIEWFGPLAERVSGDTTDLATSIHVQWQIVLLVLIVLHLLAIAAYRLFKGQNLSAAMFSGYQPGTASAAPRTAPVWLSYVLAALCAALVWAIATYGPPPLAW